MSDLFYKPGDDTFTFLRALEDENNELIKHNTFIEIGTGSGIIADYITQTFPSALVLSTDINIHAINHVYNNNKCNIILSSLLTNIKQKLIDVVIFNPPYTETVNIEHSGIDASFSGGKDGCEVINAFINQLTDIKIVYLLVIRKNIPERVIELFKKCNYEAVIIKVRRIMAETIYIIKASLSNKCINK